MKQLVSFLFLCVFLVSVAPSYAQEDVRSGNISMYPEFPKPFDKVSLTFESFSFDVDRAKITWKVNGKQVLSGYGEKKLTVSLGGDGSVTSVSLTANLAEGGVYSSSLSLSPASVDLMWDAPESYVPPLYSGKALPSEGARIHVVAVPSFFSGGKRYDPSSVVYSWSLNDEALGSLSGTGKQTLDTNLNYLENENVVKVVATTLDGAQSAEGSVTVVPTSVSPRFYLQDPLSGIHYENALEDSISINKETSFAYVPYFISATSLDSPNLTYSWSLAGLPVSAQQAGILTLRPKNGVSGSEMLSVSVEQTKKYLQKAEGALQVLFDTR